MTAVAQRIPVSPPCFEPVSAPASLSLREAVSQTSDSSRNLLGLMALADAAQRDLTSGLPEMTLDGVISKAVLRSLLGALHYRDIATLRHSRRVALLAVGLAHHLGWEGRQLRILEVSALLHDIGKVGVPDNVLYKPGKLSAQEFELMALHYRIGLNVLQACRVDSSVLKIVEQSHRASDPEEYNERTIRGVQMGARILAVADAYESLCTEQVYRKAKPHDEIMSVLMAESGKQFDGDIVSSLARWVQKDGLPFAAQSAELHDVGANRTPICVEDAAEAMTLCQIFSYLYMLESLYDGFYIVDSDRRFVVWSRGAERLVGQSAENMLGQPWVLGLFGTSDTDKASQRKNRGTSTLDHAVSQGKTVISQSLLTSDDTPSMTLELQTVPLIDARGHLHGVAEIIRNLSREAHSTEVKQAPEFKQLKLQASRDALTSVANRGELENQLKKLMDQFETNPDEPFSVIFADADHFKRVNDTYGHQVGDQVLIDLAKHFCDETYSGEIVGRYGGEEFVILCPATELEHAVRRADRLRTSMHTARVGGIDKLKVTCSFGVAQVEPGDTGESLLARADRALYSAKEAGRDRTCSLTIGQLLAAKFEEDAKGNEEPFRFSGSFSAVIGSEMVFFKLGGFISDHKALLTEATRERVVMNVSGSGLRGFFGSSPNRQGVQIELLMEGASRAGCSQKLRINVTMRPIGWFRDNHAFQVRTRTLMLDLKHYFAAE